MELWLLFALASAIFAGLTATLIKIGVKNVDSNLATALRTVIVLIFVWALVFIVGSQTAISDISSKTFIFLMFSGLSTGASWLCYIKAIQIGSVSKVTPVDKSSTVLTIILAFLLLGESMTLFTLVGIVIIVAGTYLMIQKTANDTESKDTRKSWFFFACLSAIFAAMTAILGKVGIEDIESNLGTAIRTVFVLLMAWLVVFIKKPNHSIKAVSKHNWLFIVLSGVATGLSWMCFYYALQNGPVSIVVPIDKLSIVFTIIFAYFIQKEKISFKMIIGLVLIVIGTMSLLIVF